VVVDAESGAIVGISSLFCETRRFERKVSSNCVVVVVSFRFFFCGSRNSHTSEGVRTKHMPTHPFLLFPYTQKRKRRRQKKKTKKKNTRRRETSPFDDRRIDRRHVGTTAFIPEAKRRRRRAPASKRARCWADDDDDDDDDDDGFRRGDAKKSSSSSGAGWSFAVSFASFSVKNESERGVARKPNEVEGTRDARADIDEHRDERDENDDELDEIARGAVSAWTRAIDDRSAPSAQKKRPPTPFWTNDNFVFFFVRNRTATTTIISKARTNENYNRATRKKWKTNGATNSPKDQTERTAGVGEAADDCGATKTRPTSIHSRRTFVDESAISVDFKGNVKKGDDDDDDDDNDEIDSIWTSKWCRKAATGNDSDKRGQVGKTVEEEN